MTVTAVKIPVFETRVEVVHRPEWSERWPWYILFDGDEINSYSSKEQAVAEVDYWLTGRYQQHLKRYTPSFG